MIFPQGEAASTSLPLRGPGAAVRRAHHADARRCRPVPAGDRTLLAEFLTELGLHQVILVWNDWGGAQLLVSPGGSDRVANLVLVSCEAFDNYPPGAPGRLLCSASSPRIRDANGSLGPHEHEPVAASPELRRSVLAAQAEWRTPMTSWA